VLAEVARGGAVTITSGGRDVARLVPAVEAPATLARLIERGAVRAPTLGGAVPLPPPPGDAERDVAARLVADRDAERW